MLRRATLTPERTALIFEGREFLFGELADRVRRQATLLREGGVCVGDRVGYLGFNHPALLETLFAAQALGAIFVPLNFRLTAEALTFIINDAGIHTLLVDDAPRSLLAPARERLCCRQFFSSESAAEGWRHLETERAATQPVAAPVSVDQHDVAVIRYTSSPPVPHRWPQRDDAALLSRGLGAGAAAPLRRWTGTRRFRALPGDPHVRRPRHRPNPTGRRITRSAPSPRSPGRRRCGRSVPGRGCRRRSPARCRGRSEWSAGHPRAPRRCRT
jgi:non-ribosomal peptide synthetase component F